MLTGQSGGSQPFIASSVLGFSLAFAGLPGMCGHVALLGGLQQRVS